MSKTLVNNVYIVPGQAHILLAKDQASHLQSLYDSYSKVREEIEKSESEIIIYFSTQWLSVIGYMLQGDPNPKWQHVDQNWHELGTMAYDFRVDTDFSKSCADNIALLGHTTKTVNYNGFPIDTGTIVAQKLLNPKNKLKAAMVSCNMYAEKQETVEIGKAVAKTLHETQKKATIVLVSNLSNRYHTEDISLLEDRFSSTKDDEWNQKILELFSQGKLEDVSQVAREFAAEANADLGFKGVWWLSGICGHHNNFKGRVFDYKPVYGTGAALVGLYPKEDIKLNSHHAIDSKNNLSKESALINIECKKAPNAVGPYPHIKKIDNTLFLSGIGPRKKNSQNIPGVTLGASGEILNYDIKEQTHSVFNNLKLILEEAESCLEKVIDCQVFLTNMKDDFKIFNEIYGEYFDAKSGPSRTTVEVGKLPTPIAVEFKVIAKV